MRTWTLHRVPTNRIFAGIILSRWDLLIRYNLLIDSIVSDLPQSNATNNEVRQHGKTFNDITNWPFT